MIIIIYDNLNKSTLPWRNWLARSAVNRKVGGSSPPGSDNFLVSSFLQ